MIFAITGSTGMIGLALTKYLIGLNHHIIMFVRKDCKKIDKIPSNKLINIIECDLSELEYLKPSLKCDYFIHMGWDKTIGNGRNDVFLQNMNVKYTLDAINLAKRMNAKKFVGIGSQAEYGLHNAPLSINTTCNPITGYGIAKYCAGKLGEILAEQIKMEYNWIRVLSVYGENDNSNTLISYVMDCFKKNISPEVTKCEQIWDYIECNDAAKIIYKITINGENGVIYPLGSGKGRPLREYLEELKLKLNSKVQIKYGAKPYPSNQVMYLVADMSYLNNL